MKKTTQKEKLKEAISERIEKEKLLLKQLILSSAGELFLEFGYEKFSMRKVAERIGYSATTIYLYFKDKDDLLFSILTEGFFIFNEMLQKASEMEGNTIEKLESIGISYIEFGLQYPVYYQMMFMQRTDFLFKAPPDQDSPIVKSFEVLGNLVKKAIDEGFFKNIENAEGIYGRSLWAMTHGLVSLHTCMPVKEPLDIRVVSRETMRIFMTGLRS